MDLKLLRSDPRLSDPFMRPDWRFKRVLKMISRMPSPGRTTKRDDQYIRTARSFLLRWHRGETERQRLLHEMTPMYHAFQIHENVDTDPEFRLMIEGRLLANEPYEKIAKECKTLPETVEYYEKIFFNVLPFLEHHDWIVKHVLLPANDRLGQGGDDDDDAQKFSTPVVVRPHLDWSLKFFSYFGGPIICEFMISKLKRGIYCGTQDEIGTWLNEVHMLQMQARSTEATGTFDINRYNVMEVFSAHARIMEIQQQAENEGERHNVIEKHIHSMLDEIPWTSGRDAHKVFEGTVVGELDEQAAEINSEELMLLQAGNRIENLDDIISMNLNNAQSESEKGAGNADA